MARELSRAAEPESISRARVCGGRVALVSVQGYGIELRKQSIKKIIFSTTVGEIIFSCHWTGATALFDDGYRWNAR